MHTLDLGLFKYMLEYTKDLLNNQCKRQVMQNFEQRLTLIPRHQGLKILKNISEITRMTADEFRNLMKVIIFALDNLYKDYRKPGISNERLCSVYHQFLLMYIASREESFTDDSLTKLQVYKINKIFANKITLQDYVPKGNFVSKNPKYIALKHLIINDY